LDCANAFDVARRMNSPHLDVTDRVGPVLREVAASIVLPRFASLRPSDVMMKGKHEPVTIADREAEETIGRELMRLLPGARVVGEEACAANPALLRDVHEGTVWVIDPIDGTANFAAGRQPFAMMVALLKEGELVGAWILDPLSDRLVVAERGAGARIEDVPLRTRSALPGAHDLSGIVSEAFLPTDKNSIVEAIRAAVAEVVPTVRCSGHEYPLVALGNRHFALYWRTLLWDHAPGALILTEAGGTVTYLDGTPYDPCRSQTGLLLAHNDQVSNHLLSAIGRQI
jgi:fructose-1,6-bisphosphatase/inositol monophosphatase family enzyme